MRVVGVMRCDGDGGAPETMISLHGGGVVLVVVRVVDAGPGEGAIWSEGAEGAGGAE